MLAAAKRIDITPENPVWMDGMLRDHPSTGVHDRIYAKAVALANSDNPPDCFVVVSIDVYALADDDAQKIRKVASQKTGIPAGNIILAATHNHSGPSLLGIITPRADEYLEYLIQQLPELIADVSRNLQPALAGWATGQEKTISHYRRLMTDDGHVVMNWEQFPAENIIGPLGEIDPELLILRIFTAQPSPGPLALIFNHAGHPNVLSGDNYLISSDYPGLAEKLLEDKGFGMSMFLNGAQGSVDIDGLKDRDFDGLDRIGQALADATNSSAASIKPTDLKIRCLTHEFMVPARKITDAEMAWAEGVLKHADGKTKAAADGGGDDYKARLYRDLRRHQNQDIRVEHSCLAVGDCAFITFPGELFTEIGMRIKAASPFTRTGIIGLANGYSGYIPTAKAILEGGYEPDTRRMDAAAEDVIFDNSLNLLKQVHADIPAS